MFIFFNMCNNLVQGFKIVLLQIYYDYEWRMVSPVWSICDLIPFQYIGVDLWDGIFLCEDC